LLLASGAPAAAAPMHCTITDYGARPGDDALDTDALAEAVRDCHQSGGGTVVVPAGTFTAGTVELLSHVTLHLQEGAVLEASTNPDDYRAVETVGYDYDTPFLYARDAESVAIVGRGVIDGSGKAFMDMEAPHTYVGYRAEATRQGASYDPDSLTLQDGPVRPLRTGEDNREGEQLRYDIMVLFLRCENVLVEGVTIRNSANWCLHINGSDGARVTGVTVDNSLLIPNTDAIDVTESRNVHISGCTLRSGDDGIVMGPTAGAGEHKRTENIVISNTIITSRSSGIRVGNGAGGFRHIIVRGVIIRESNRGIGVFVRDEGSVEDVLFSDIQIETRLHTGWWGAGEPIHVSAIPGTEPTDVSSAEAADPFETDDLREADIEALGRIRNVRFSNVTATAEHGVVVYGQERGHIDDLSFENLQLHLTDSPLAQSYGGNFDLSPVVDPSYAVFEHDIPAFFFRGVDRLTLRDLEVAWGEGALPEYFSQAVAGKMFEDFSLDGFTGGPAHDGDATIRLRDGSGVTVQNATATPGTGLFLRLDGVMEKGLFMNNDLRNARRAVVPADAGFVRSGNAMPKR
jgi:hypothetical protein